MAVFDVCTDEMLDKEDDCVVGKFEVALKVLACCVFGVVYSSLIGKFVLKFDVWTSKELENVVCSCVTSKSVVLTDVLTDESELYSILCEDVIGGLIVEFDVWKGEEIEEVIFSCAFGKLVGKFDV